MNRTHCSAECLYIAWPLILFSINQTTKMPDLHGVALTRQYKSQHKIAEADYARTRAF